MGIQRREFVRSAGVMGIGTMLKAGGRHGAGLLEVTGSSPISGGPAVWRDHFPALRQKVAGRPIAYLDSAATSLRPRPVIEAISGFYAGPNANPGATLHTLARRAAELYDGARADLAHFVGGADPLELVFTRGTTEAINLAAATLEQRLKAGDEILLTEGEHASNMLPWQVAAERTGAIVRHAAITGDGHVDRESFARMLNSRPRIVAISHVSNVVGIINPVREMCRQAREAGALTLVDAAQSAPHIGVDVRDIGCDFLAFSSHKMCGPMGAGALWARRELLESLPPYQCGSNMAHAVGLDSRHYSDGALKYGAGTPNVADAIGFAAAARFLSAIGWDVLRAHEQAINARMLAGLARVPGLRLLGSTSAAGRIGVFAFTLEGREPLDVVAALDHRGIAVRAGDLAALPLLKRLGATTAVRASCYLYTTIEEVDRLVAELEQIAIRR